MSLDKNTRERLKTYLIEQISKQSSNFVKNVADAFAISTKSVYPYINELLKSGIILKISDNNYRLTTNTYRFSYKISDELEEDTIYERDISPLIIHLNNNIRKIWQYSFTEMMNNAIEHSNADIINVFVNIDAYKTEIYIIDKGIGIFNKIRAYLKETTNKEASLEDAVTALFKGKLTTDKANHSGEGVFFTSRAIGRFSIISSRCIFTHDELDNLSLDEEILRNSEDDAGTFVLMSLPNNSTRQLTEVFDMFSDPERGFFKTQIPIKYALSDSFAVSRSQARRLYSRLDQFEEVELDFAGIDDIGQGFAHEFFVVFKNRYPNIKITVTNQNEAVDKMIRRVEATAKASDISSSS